MDRLMSTKEAAKHLGYKSLWYFRAQCKKRGIPKYKIGHYYKYKLSDLERYVKDNSVNLVIEKPKQYKRKYE